MGLLEGNSWIVWIIIGGIAGAIAKLLMPGKDPGGCIVTILLGIAGALLAGFIGFFALSQGAVIWVYLGEVFPTSVRAKGQGVGSASHWIVNTILALCFPLVAERFGQSTPFWFFAAATLVQLVVVSLFYPETRGQTLEQLQARLMR